MQYIIYLNISMVVFIVIITQIAFYEFVSGRTIGNPVQFINGTMVCV